MIKIAKIRDYLLVDGNEPFIAKQVARHPFRSTFMTRLLIIQPFLAMEIFPNRTHIRVISTSVIS